MPIVEPIQKLKRMDKKRRRINNVMCQLSLTPQPQPQPQTLPLLTPPFCTVGWLAKTLEEEKITPMWHMINKWAHLFLLNSFWLMLSLILALDRVEVEGNMANLITIIDFLFGQNLI